MQPLGGSRLFRRSLPSVIVLRPVLRPYLALLLLLCLVRTLLPEAWVLALHGHAHTTELVATRRAPAGKELLSPKHTHCYTDQFYNTPFEPAAQVRVPRPRLRATYRVLAVAPPLACSAAALRRTALRGPPVA